MRSPGFRLFGSPAWLKILLGVILLQLSIIAIFITVALVIVVLLAVELFVVHLVVIVPILVFVWRRATESRNLWDVKRNGRLRGG